MHSSARCETFQFASLMPCTNLHAQHVGNYTVCMQQANTETQ